MSISSDSSRRDSFVSTDSLLQQKKTKKRYSRSCLLKTCAIFSIIQLLLFVLGYFVIAPWVTEMVMERISIQQIANFLPDKIPVTLVSQVFQEPTSSDTANIMMDIQLEPQNYILFPIHLRVSSLNFKLYIIPVDEFTKSGKKASGKELVQISLSEIAFDGFTKNKMSLKSGVELKNPEVMGEFINTLINDKLGPDKGNIVIDGTFKFSVMGLPNRKVDFTRYIDLNNQSLNSFSTLLSPLAKDKSLKIIPKSISVGAEGAENGLSSILKINVQNDTPLELYIPATILQIKLKDSELLKISSGAIEMKKGPTLIEIKSSIILPEIDNLKLAVKSISDDITRGETPQISFQGPISMKTLNTNTDLDWLKKLSEKIIISAKSGIFKDSKGSFDLIGLLFSLDVSTEIIGPKTVMHVAFDVGDLPCPVVLEATSSISLFQNQVAILDLGFENFKVDGKVSLDVYMLSHETEGAASAFAEMVEGKSDLKLQASINLGGKPMLNGLKIDLPISGNVKKILDSYLFGDSLQKLNVQVPNYGIMPSFENVVFDVSEKSPEVEMSAIMHIPNLPGKFQIYFPLSFNLVVLHQKSYLLMTTKIEFNFNTEKDVPISIKTTFSNDDESKDQIARFFTMGEQKLAVSGLTLGGAKVFQSAKFLPLSFQDYKNAIKNMIRIFGSKKITEQDLQKLLQSPYLKPLKSIKIGPSGGGEGINTNIQINIPDSMKSVTLPNFKSHVLINNIKILDFLILRTAFKRGDNSIVASVVFPENIAALNQGLKIEVGGIEFGAILTFSKVFVSLSFDSEISLDQLNQMTEGLPIGDAQIIVHQDKPLITSFTSLPDIKTPFDFSVDVPVSFGVHVLNQGTQATFMMISLQTVLKTNTKNSFTLSINYDNSQETQNVFSELSRSSFLGVGNLQIAGSQRLAKVNLIQMSFGEIGETVKKLSSNLKPPPPPSKLVEMLPPEVQTLLQNLLYSETSTTETGILQLAGIKLPKIPLVGTLSTGDINLFVTLNGNPFIRITVLKQETNLKGGKLDSRILIEPNVASIQDIQNIDFKTAVIGIGGLKLGGTDTFSKLFFSFNVPSSSPQFDPQKIIELMQMVGISPVSVLGSEQEPLLQVIVPLVPPILGFSYKINLPISLMVQIQSQNSVNLMEITVDLILDSEKPTSIISNTIFSNSKESQDALSFFVNSLITKQNLNQEIVISGLKLGEMQALSSLSLFRVPLHSLLTPSNVEFAIDYLELKPSQTSPGFDITVEIDLSFLPPVIEQLKLPIAESKIYLNTIMFLSAKSKVNFDPNTKKVQLLLASDFENTKEIARKISQINFQQGIQLVVSGAEMGPVKLFSNLNIQVPMNAPPTGQISMEQISRYLSIDMVQSKEGKPEFESTGTIILPPLIQKYVKRLSLDVGETTLQILMNNKPVIGIQVSTALIELTRPLVYKLRVVFSNQQSSVEAARNFIQGIISKNMNSISLSVGNIILGGKNSIMTFVETEFKIPLVASLGPVPENVIKVDTIVLNQLSNEPGYVNIIRLKIMEPNPLKTFFLHSCTLQFSVENQKMITIQIPNGIKIQNSILEIESRVIFSNTNETQEAVRVFMEKFLGYFSGQIQSFGVGQEPIFRIENLVFGGPDPASKVYTFSKSQIDLPALLKKPEGGLEKLGITISINPEFMNGIGVSPKITVPNYFKLILSLGGAKLDLYGSNETHLWAETGTITKSVDQNEITVGKSQLHFQKDSGITGLLGSGLGLLPALIKEGKSALYATNLKLGLIETLSKVKFSAALL